MKVRTLTFAFILFRFVASATTSAAESPDTTVQHDVVITHSAESAKDVRHDYFTEVLKAALEKTRAEYGDYDWREVPDMSHRRQKKSLHDGRITVMIQTASVELQKEFVAVKLPLDRGMLGYRVFLIRREDAPKFAAVKTVQDLRRLSVGQGSGWLDGALWRHNGFRVVEGSSYEGLFQMLDQGRFDFFSRGVGEALEEYEARKTELPGMMIEPTLCVYYHWPRYAYCRDTPEGRRLAARLEKGMLALFADRAMFDPIFERHFGETFRRLDLKSRTLIRLENPDLPTDAPIGRRELWYDPFANGVSGAKKPSP